MPVVSSFRLHPSYLLPILLVFITFVSTVFAQDRYAANLAIVSRTRFLAGASGCQGWALRPEGLSSEIIVMRANTRQCPVGDQFY